VNLVNNLLAYIFSILLIIGLILIFILIILPEIRKSIKNKKRYRGLRDYQNLKKLQKLDIPKPPKHTKKSIGLIPICIKRDFEKGYTLPQIEEDLLKKGYTPGDFDKHLLPYLKRALIIDEKETQTKEALVERLRLGKLKKKNKTLKKQKL